MPLDLASRLSFSSIVSTHQIAWDSTSLGEFKMCPRRYYYSILQGYVTRSENVHLKFGTEFHAALEAYDRARATGADHDAAMMSAVLRVLTATWDETLSRPWTSDDPNKNRDTLLRSIIWYLDQFEHDPCETVVLADGSPAVELSFRFEPDLVSKLTGEQYILCGHLDRLVRFHDRLWIVDRKTTKSTLSQDYFDKYSPDNQVSLYCLAGTVVAHEPISGLIIDAAQIAVSFSRFQRQQIPRTQTSLTEWLRDTQRFIEDAERCAEEEYWPMNDKSCGQFGGCGYRPVCSTSPELRQSLLDTMFTRRSWDPLKTREI